ncbi:MAG: ABC transporter permease [Bacillota bacterium]
MLSREVSGSSGLEYKGWRGGRLAAFWTAYKLYIVFGALVVISGLISPRFFTVENIMNLLLRSSFVGLVSLGMTFVILTGGIDLSVGATFAFAGVLLATFQHGFFFRFMPELTAGFEQSRELAPIMPFLPTLLLTLGVGALLGFINGVLVTKAGMPPFVVTLGAMVAIRGLAFTYTAGFPIPGITHEVEWLGAGRVGVLPVPVMIWALVSVACMFVLRSSVFGKKVYAVGGNERASWLSGIDSDRVRIIVYTISGVLATLAGVLMLGRMGAAEPREGAGMEADAIAAAIIGGTSLSGGRGSIAGTVIGALVLGLISNILNLMEVPPYPQQVAKGLIIIAAVLMQGATRRR